MQLTHALVSSLLISVTNSRSLPPGTPSSPFANETQLYYNRTWPEHGNHTEGRFKDIEGPRFDDTDGLHFNDTNQPRFGGADHSRSDGSHHPGSDQTDNSHFNGGDGPYHEITEQSPWNETDHPHWNDTANSSFNTTVDPRPTEVHSWARRNHAKHFDKRSYSQLIKCPKGSTPRAGNIAYPNKFNYVACCKDHTYDRLSGSLSANGALQCEMPAEPGDLFVDATPQVLGEPESSPQCLAHYYVCHDKGFEKACCKPVIDA